MLTTAAIAQTAALIVDPTRATMLAALMDGRALTAKELAMAAGVTEGRGAADARTCYDHLAGQLAVAMADRMTERGQIEFSPDGGAITEDGTSFLRGLGVDLDAACGRAARRGGGRVFCRPCLDWSERRPHIAGALGAAVCTACFAQGWIRRIEGTRAVHVTPIGRLVLNRAFALRVASTDRSSVSC